jgi:hypothetical protein
LFPAPLAITVTVDVPAPPTPFELPTAPVPHPLIEMKAGPTTNQSANIIIDLLNLIILDASTRFITLTPFHSVTHAATMKQPDVYYRIDTPTRFNDK